MARKSCHPRDEDPVPLTRQMHDWGGSSAEREIVSIADQAARRAAISYTCLFCGLPQIGEPFNAHQLLAAHPGNVGTAWTEDAMDGDGASEQSYLWTLLQSHGMTVCSAACWMARTLIMYDERSPIGIIVKRAFPGLLPEAIGGPLLERYTEMRRVR